MKSLPLDACGSGERVHADSTAPALRPVEMLGA